MSQSTVDDLYCRQSRLSDVAVFFLINIFAHAATVPSIPGSTTTEIILFALESILIPFCGVGRAVRIIFKSPVFASSPLEKAAWAYAICVVGRTRHWRASEGAVMSFHGDHAFFTDWKPKSKRFTYGYSRSNIENRH